MYEGRPPERLLVISAGREQSEWSGRNWFVAGDEGRLKALGRVWAE